MTLTRLTVHMGLRRSGTDLFTPGGYRVGDVNLTAPFGRQPAKAK